MTRVPRDGVEAGGGDGRRGPGALERGRAGRQVRAPDEGHGGGLAYVLVRIAVYLAALVPYVLLYGTKQRALFIAPPVGLIGALATWFLLRNAPIPRGRQLVHAGVVGLVLMELTWAFGYWTVAPIVGGAALWLAFYVLSGVAEHGALGTLDRRVAIEYAGVSLVGVLVVLATAPWNP